MLGSRLARDLVRTPPWREVRVVAGTGSTNADVAAEARAGAAEGLVVFAEQQDGGRGRLDRSWQSPPRAGLLMSALLRPQVPGAVLPLVPLLTGVAVVEAVRAVAGLEAVLKWPNDVLVGDRKLGGILVERVDDAVVVGVGINVSTRPDELPVPAATSIGIEGGRTDREPLAKEVLRSLARRYVAFVEAGGSPGAVLPAYRDVCETIGRDVVVRLPGDRQASGVAVDVDDSGMLVIQTPDGMRNAWSAGDVEHVRRGG
jgi:BirA family transcriptional regulator, biotin operon repressor / biotin---[acetyl-CoA-carboxylase] ligase